MIGLTSRVVFFTATNIQKLKAIKFTLQHTLRCNQLYVTGQHTNFS